MKLVQVLLFVCILKVPKSSGAQQANVAPVNTISGFYDTLYVEAAKFKALDNDTYVFVTAIDNDGGLTLKGWQTLGLHGRRFSKNPSITPVRGYPSQIKFGVNSLFADVVVNKKGIKKIKKTLDKTGHKYVMFAPNLLKGDFLYRVCTGNTRPGPLPPGQDEQMAVRERAAESDIFLNPSPPKQFY